MLLYLDLQNNEMSEVEKTPPEEHMFSNIRCAGRRT